MAKVIIPNTWEPFRHFDFRFNFSRIQEEKAEQQQSSSEPKKNTGYRDQKMFDDQQYSESDDSETEETNENISSNETLKKLIAQLKNLMDKIKEMISKKVNIDERTRNGLYMELMNILEQLIHNHAAVFNHRSAPRNVNGITLTVGDEHVTFGRDIQSFFHGVVTAMQGNAMAHGKSFSSIIYRIRCCKCQPGQFNYVGQTVVQMNQRANLHIHTINKNRNVLLAKHLQTKHSNLDPNAAYEMDLLHYLPVNALSPKDRSPGGLRDKRIRRAWEMFYQWVCKAMDFDGGGCKK